MVTDGNSMFEHMADRGSKRQWKSLNLNPSSSHILVKTVFYVPSNVRAKKCAMIDLQEYFAVENSRV